MLSPKHCCLCFAVPSNFFKKLASRAEGSDRAALGAHIAGSIQLRAMRHAPAKQTAPAPAAFAAASRHAYRRRVFSANTLTELHGTPVRQELSRPAKDKAVNQVFDNTGIALDFFHHILGRHSLDGRSMQVDSYVHFGQNFANAMWTGRHMIYGDGDHHVSGFTQALDIIAHELSHGVIQYLIPGGLGIHKIPEKERQFKEQSLVLKGQSGALNESFADIIGSMVKQWHKKQNVRKANWLLGERMLAPQHGRAIRSLKDPGNRALTWFEDDQIKSMDHFHEDADVHDSSGIPNHAFYLAASSLGGCSWEHVGPIWYDAYAMLKPKAKFADAARATLKIASARHGKGSKEFIAVKMAWQTVKVLP